MEAHNDQSLELESSESALPSLLVSLLKGVVYQDRDASRWKQLLGLQAAVRDYMKVLGLELMLDEAEGYAFLRTRINADADEPDANNTSAQRLIARRPLSFPVSLLLALLRKKLAEFDASGGDTRLILSRDELMELIEVFLPDSSNQAKLVDQIERHINKIVDLGFLTRLKSSGANQPARYEVRRILKSFVDAQWLAQFDQMLESYKAHASATQEPADEVDG
ncbi:MAG: hypothetical protein ACI9KN_000850 [Gammaproteobacteria bacterium]|jgi:hypothetical protein